MRTVFRPAFYLPQLKNGKQKLSEYKKSVINFEFVTSAPAELKKIPCNSTCMPQSVDWIKG